jgi:hypothetical protein
MTQSTLKIRTSTKIIIGVLWFLVVVTIIFIMDKACQIFFTVCYL